MISTCIFFPIMHVSTKSKHPASRRGAANFTPLPISRIYEQASIPGLLPAPGHDPQRVPQDLCLIILCQLPRGPGLVELVPQAGSRLGCVLGSDGLLVSSGVAHFVSFLPPGGRALVMRPLYSTAPMPSRTAFTVSVKIIRQLYKGEYQKCGLTN